MNFDRRIVLFGDSLTRRGFLVSQLGWGLHVIEEYVHSVDVVCRGFGGYNTEWAKCILPELFPICSERELNRSPIMLFNIFFGTNDAICSSEKSHVSLEKYYRNLGDMIDYMQEFGQEQKKRTGCQLHIMMTTPPPVNDFVEYGYSTNKSSVWRNESARKYAMACRQVAQSRNIPCLDIFTEISSIDSANAPSYAHIFDSDGVHFSKDGNIYLGYLFMNFVKSNFPNISPSALLWRFPVFTQVDPSDLQTTLLGEKR